MCKIFKRSLSFFLAVIMVVSVVSIVDNSFAIKAKAASYNASKASQYALLYWNNYNPNYSNYNSVGGDCANFVSQCLYAGGLPMDNNWYWYSYSNRSASWTGALSIKKYLVDILGYDLIMYPSASQIEVGDVLWYDEGSHVAICSEVRDGVPWVCAHNRDLHTSNWKLGFSSYGVIKMRGETQHSHNFVTENEYAHPHKQYTKCYGCGTYSYTGNTLYLDRCDDCVALNTVDLWASCSADENDPALSEGVVGGYYFIWYKVYHRETGALYGTYGNRQYTAKISIFYPDGTELFSTEYENSYLNWISVPVDQIGNYRMNITLSGELNVSYDEYFTVKSDGEFIFSPQTLNLDLENKKTGTIELSLEGNWPDGAKAYLTLSNDNISFTRSGSTITVTALKAGLSEIVVTVYDAYGNLFYTSSAFVNVTEPKYTVAYSGNGSVDVPGNQTKYYSSPLTLSSYKPKRTGYTFVEWNTKSDGTGTKYLPGGSYNVNSSAKLYAIWKANSYMVSFYANGGTVSPSNKVVTYDSTYGTLPTPTRSGYIFEGWFTAQSGGTKVTSSTEVLTTANHTLYARWTEVTLVSISVKTKPTKVNYFVGDTFDPSGLTLNATYSDGTIKAISSGYVCTYTTIYNYEGSQPIGVTYGGKSTMFFVNVSFAETTVPYVTLPSTTEHVEVSTTQPDVTEPSTTEFFEVQTTSKPVEIPTITNSVVTEPVTTKPAEVSTTKPTTEPTTKPVEIPTTTKPIETTKPVVEPTKPFVTTKPVSTTKPEPIEEEIIKKPSTSTVKYGETLILHADFANIPEDAKIEWSVDGNGVTINPSADGKTCAVKSTATGDVTVTAKYTDVNGVEHVSEQEIKSNASFWQKIVSFFKNLFRMNRIIEQRIKF